MPAYWVVIKNEIGSVSVTPTANADWKKYDISFNALDTALKGAFKLSFEGEGIIDLDMISLFPSTPGKAVLEVYVQI